MLRTLALMGLITTLPSFGLAQATTGKSTVELTADLLGSNENPPVNTPSGGAFTITMDFDVEVDDDGAFENVGEAIQNGFDGFLGFFGVGDDDDDDSATLRGVELERGDVKKATVSVRGNLDKPAGSASQNITGFHIHRGRAGVNGPVLVNFGVADVGAQAGSTRLSRSVVLSSSMDVDTALAIARNPSEYYLNLHTTENPSGEVRGQLRRSADDQRRLLRSEMMLLTRELQQTRTDLQRLLAATELRQAQLNRIDANVAAIGRRNGLNTNSEEVVGSAR